MDNYNDKEHRNVIRNIKIDKRNVYKIKYILFQTKIQNKHKIMLSITVFWTVEAGECLHLHQEIMKGKVYPNFFFNIKSSNSLLWKRKTWGHLKYGNLHRGLITLTVYV